MLTAVFHRNVNTFVARGVLRWLCLTVARRWPVTFFIACLLHKAQLVSGHHEFVPGCCLYFVEERELQPIATNGTTARMRKSHWLPWREWGWPRCTPLTTKARAWGIVMRLFRRRIVLRGSILFVCCVSSKQAGYSSECCYFVLFLSASFFGWCFPRQRDTAFPGVREPRTSRGADNCSLVERLRGIQQYKCRHLLDRGDGRKMLVLLFLWHCT